MSTLNEVTETPVAQGVLERVDAVRDLRTFAGATSGFVEAPAGLLRAAANAIAAVRTMHHPLTYEGVTYCAGCWDQPGSGTRLLFPCPTFVLFGADWTVPTPA